MKNDDKKDGVRVLTKNLQTGLEKALIHKTSTIVANLPTFARKYPIVPSGVLGSEGQAKSLNHRGVLPIMPERSVREETEYPMKMERYFHRFFTPFLNSLHE